MRELRSPGSGVDGSRARRARTPQPLFLLERSRTPLVPTRVGELGRPRASRRSRLSRRRRERLLGLVAPSDLRCTVLDLARGRRPRGRRADRVSRGTHPRPAATGHRLHRCGERPHRQRSRDRRSGPPPRRALQERALVWSPGLRCLVVLDPQGGGDLLLRWPRRAVFHHASRLVLPASRTGPRRCRVPAHGEPGRHHHPRPVLARGRRLHLGRLRGCSPSDRRAGCSGRSSSCCSSLRGSESGSAFRRRISSSTSSSSSRPCSSSSGSSIASGGGSSSRRILLCGMVLTKREGLLLGALLLARGTARIRSSVADDVARPGRVGGLRRRRRDAVADLVRHSRRRRRGPVGRLHPEGSTSSGSWPSVRRALDVLWDPGYWSLIIPRRGRCVDPRSSGARQRPGRVLRIAARLGDARRDLGNVGVLQALDNRGAGGNFIIRFMGSAALLCAAATSTAPRAPRGEPRRPRAETRRET